MQPELMERRILRIEEVMEVTRLAEVHHLCAD